MGGDYLVVAFILTVFSAVKFYDGSLSHRLKSRYLTFHTFGNRTPPTILPTSFTLNLVVQICRTTCGFQNLVLHIPSLCLQCPSV